MEQLSHLFYNIIADTKDENIYLARLKDKSAYGMLKILIDQLDQEPNIRLNEKITFSPKNKNKSNVEKWNKAIIDYLESENYSEI